jgi:tetratricopeptide (TPR) repeat protein
MSGEFEHARSMYQEAMGAEADCLEAIYNLAVVNKRLSDHQSALGLFEKLHAIIPNSVEVVWQIADLFDAANQSRNAIKWFKILNARVPTDPAVLARIGNIYLKEEEEAQAFHYHQESYRYYPVNMNVISWLGAYFVKNEMYEKAVAYFERAAQIQPKEVKWKLMVASCHRRSGDYQLAFEIYRVIHADFPDNIECLRYLVHICDDLGKKDQVHEYVVKLRKAERAVEPQQEQEQQYAPPQQGYQEQYAPQHEQQQPMRPVARAEPRLLARDVRAPPFLASRERRLAAAPLLLRTHTHASSRRPAGESDYEQSQVMAAGHQKVGGPTKKVAAGGVGDDLFGDDELEDDLLPH